MKIWSSFARSTFGTPNRAKTIGLPTFFALVQHATALNLAVLFWLHL